MAFPLASNQPSYSGTPGTGSFIPQIWSKKLASKFYDATVLTAISNTDYQGEITAQGDLVRIRTIPSLAISDYTAGQNLVLQRPTSNVIDLLIDKGKSWSAVVDDVIDVQSDLNLMNMWAQDAAEQMMISIDTVVLGSIVPSFSAQNRGNTAGRVSANIPLGATGAPVLLTKANVIDHLVDLGQTLDEQNIPQTGRYVVLPFWVAALLKKSDLKNADMMGDVSGSVLRNGLLGTIDRFTVYQSNNLPSVLDTGRQAYSIIAGHKQGLTFASQLVKTETIRAESTFGNIMRGLQVFGFQITVPTALASGYVARG
jgi:hypothetical protein